MMKVPRRSFLLSSLSIATARFVVRDTVAARARPQIDVDVTLVARAPDVGRELVSFGLPLPPGLLSDPRRASVLDDAGREIPAAVRVLEPWRLGGRAGSARSLLIQFTADFAPGQSRRFKVVVGRPRRANVAHFTSVDRTLLDPRA